MKVSDHLTEYHKASAAHNSEMIEAHEAALDKASAMEGSPHHTAFHKAVIKSYEKMRDFHLDAMEECQKAAADSLNKIVPDGVRGIVPNYPTAVPRYGQRELGKADVPPEFEHFVEVETGI